MKDSRSHGSEQNVALAILDRHNPNDRDYVRLGSAALWRLTFQGAGDSNFSLENILVGAVRNPKYKNRSLRLKALSFGVLIQFLSYFFFGIIL